MIKIRLARSGTKQKPAYRLIALDSHKKNQTRILDVVGFYDPKTKPTTLKIDKEKLAYWQKQGAQLATGVQKIINSEKTS